MPYTSWYSDYTKGYGKGASFPPSSFKPLLMIAFLFVRWQQCIKEGQWRLHGGEA